MSTTIDKGESSRTLAESALQATRAVSNPASLRGLVAAVAGAVVLLLPGLTTVALQIVLAVAVGLSAFIDLTYALTGRRRVGRERRRLFTAVRGLGSVLLLAALVVLPMVMDRDAATVRLSLIVAIVGAYLAARGFVVVVIAATRRGVTHRGIRLASGITAMAVGALGVTVPATAASFVVTAVAVATMVIGLILVAWGFRREASGPSSVDPATATVGDVLWDWVEGSNVGDRFRADIADDVYLEEPDRFSKATGWWVMLLLSVAIATFAVLADSTAVVIGAMLVAPLMAPILGLAAALVNGWTARAVRAAALVAGGTVTAIALAYGLASWAPVAVSFDSNSQIVSRVTPTLLDMLVAVAAGAAGAFAKANKRVSDGIAGVAIAVALVPPLAVVGVSLSGGHRGDAMGAFLLFLTNFVAIVISAATVFVLTGVADYSRLRENPGRILLTVMPFVAVAAVILLPLMFTSQGLLTTSALQKGAQQEVEQWLGDDSELLVQSIVVSTDEVKVSLIGAGTPPPARELQSALVEELHRSVALTVTVTPVDVTRLPAP